jgi:hypothetical protein
MGDKLPGDSTGDQPKGEGSEQFDVGQLLQEGMKGLQELSQRLTPKSAEDNRQSIFDQIPNVFGNNNHSESGALRQLRPKIDPQMLDAVKTGEKLADEWLRGDMNAYNQDLARLRKDNHLHINDAKQCYLDRIAHIEFEVNQLPDGPQKQDLQMKLGMRLRTLSRQDQQYIEGKCGQETQAYYNQLNDQAQHNYATQHAFDGGVTQDPRESTAAAQKLATFLYRILTPKS